MLLSDRALSADEQEGLLFEQPVRLVTTADSDLAARLGENLPAVHGPDSLAYVLYTSGTTGVPKGVMIEHRNVVQLLHNDQLPFDFGAEDVWSVFHAYGFDFSVWEMYGALLYGGRCVIVPRAVAQSPAAFLELLIAEGVTVLNQTPTAFYGLIREACEESKGLQQPKLAVRYVIFGGEALQPQMLKPWKAAYPEITLVNMYGITETTVHVTYKEITEAELASKMSVIGLPLPTVTGYVMDSERRLVPVGVAGELYVGGDGVARGYLNRDELTSERFVTNPYWPQERLYRSGDLMKRRVDGELEYLGRIDHQVKIRGHRIEIGEVEHRLLSHLFVQEATVLAQELQEQTELCAYVVLREEVTISELRTYMQAGLPAYMVPSQYIRLEQIPLTVNGKIDRKALLASPHSYLRTGVEHIAPRDELERELVSIWQEVLGVKQVGIRDHFFEIGGHSLKASQLVSSIHKKLGYPLPLPVIFSKPTIEEQASFLREQSSLHTGTAYTPIRKVEKQAHYPVSSGQKRMFMLDQLEGDETFYHITGGLEIAGTVDEAKLEGAVQALMIRHETLRTSFELVQDEPVQKIAERMECPIETFEADEREISETIKRFIRPFRLDQAPLFRVGRVKISEKRHILLLDMHHIISDAVSLRLLISELSELYQGKKLPELQLQYKDYSAWQAERVHAEAYQLQEQFWLQTMAGELPLKQLAADFVRPAVQSFKGEYMYFQLDQDLTQKVAQLNYQLQMTPFMVFLAAFQLLLAKYTGQEDIIVGTPIAGRTHEDLQQMIGIFINTLAMRGYTQPDKTLAAFLEEGKLMALKAFEHQEYPFDHLVDRLRVPRDISRNPLFDGMFIMQNAGQAQWHATDFTAKPYPLEHTSLPFELLLEASEQDGRFAFSLQFNSLLFKRETVSRMASHFIQILNQLVERPQTVIADLDLVTAEEKQELIVAFNQTDHVYAKDKMIHELFEAQVDRTPDQIAVVSQGMSLTYAELNMQANRLAHLLRSKGAGPDQIIAVMVNRSLELLVGLMGVLKSGAAYLPVDPDYPEEQISYMLEHSGAALLLVNDTNKAPLTFSGETIQLEEIIREASLASTNLLSNSSSEHLAYVIYTSGSTGKPKGVMLEHRAVHNFIEGMLLRIPFEKFRTIVSLTTVSFDIFVTETLLPLTRGLKVVMASESEQREPRLLSKLLIEQQVEIMQTTPSRMGMLCQDQVAALGLERLKLLLVGGEAFPASLQAQLLQVTQAQIYNVYGPTETTVWSTIQEVTTVGDVTIGKAIANTRIYIVDANNRLLPIGIQGELCIAGDGLARGYLNDARLTSDKFAENPFEPGTRMYRTGDAARWLSDGSIEYVGRIDDQLKVRGYRIEPAGIEAVLLQYPSVSMAAVIGRKDKSNETILCAYLVAESPVDAAELRAFIISKLPVYMVPSYLLQMESLPLTANGKINRKLLPEPEDQLVGSVIYRKPETQLERKISEIWEKVLSYSPVGLDHSFFEIGGNSLKAARMMTEIERAFEIGLSLKDIFLHPTVSQLAVCIKLAVKSEGSAILLPAARRAYYPLSSAQHRMYVVHQFEPASTSYNMPLFITAKGLFDASRFERVVHQLVDRHAALRTSFHVVDGELVQRVVPETDVQIVSYEALADQTEELVQSFIRPFDLSEAPLFRAGLIRVEADQHILMLDMHHSISDGLSLEILQQEFIRLYHGDMLPPLRIQYTDYTIWQQQFKQTEAYHNQEKYWLDKFADHIPVLSLPEDRPRPSFLSFEGDSCTFTLGKELSKQIRELAAHTGTTLYMTLLSGFKVLLHSCTGQEDIIVGSPVAGRTLPDVQQLLGMFVNMVALRSHPSADKTFIQYVNEIRDLVIEAHAHQDYAYETLVEKLELGRETDRNPLFDVVFMLHNHLEQQYHSEELSLSPYPWSYQTAKFDLTCEAVELEEEIGFTIQYAVNLFERETIENLSRQLVQIWTSICLNPDTKLGELEHVSWEEQQRILAFNPERSVYPREKSIHRLFEEQAARTPEHIALNVEGQTVTYADLDVRANRLATSLRQKGVQPDHVVGILLDRSIDMIVATLAILKAGGAYLPLDPEMPPERIAYMVANSASHCVLTRAKSLGKLELPVMMIDLDAEDSYSGYGEPLPEVNQASDLAYVMYTSGSTGEPKGVMVTHRNVVRLVMNTNYVDIMKEDRMLLTGATGFDATTFEIWAALLHGIPLYLYPKETILDADLLKEVINEQAISIMWLTSPLFNELLKQREHLFTTLRYLIIGGESLSWPHVKIALERSPELRIVNGYGPTENTTFSTYHPIDLSQNGPIPIGKPISNSTAYVLDEQMRILPIGAIGELFVGGDGVARGYLGNPVLTREKFLPNPFQPGETMYRTGDLAKWQPGGILTYMGRKDQQIKIRGHRVEPKEIEGKLLAHPAIREAVVIDRTDERGDKYLCAYLVTDEELTAGHLREYAAQTLPTYMVPAYYERIESIPLTSNGKINRKMLPVPNLEVATALEAAAPRSETEQALLEVMQEVLGRTGIGIHHNFFDEGGDSIKGIQIAARLKKYGLKLEMKNLFQYPTIAQLAPHITASKLVISQAPVEGEIPLTPIQHWFFAYRPADIHHWNQSVMLQSENSLNPGYVERLLNKLLEHHDALRIVFRESDERMMQWNEKPRSEENRVRIATFDMRDELEPADLVEQAANQLQSSLNLQDGPLVVAGMFHTSTGDHLLIAAHHLVIDGVSWRILMDDFVRGYSQLMEGREIVLEDKTTSFRDWSEQLQLYSRSRKLLKEAAYWERLEQVSYVPIFFDQVSQSKEIRVHSVGLTKEETEQFSLAHRAYHTEINDLLLAALGLTLTSWLNVPHAVIDMEGHGREEIMTGVDITRTIGWFTSIYPVILRRGSKEQLSEHIIATKEMIRKIPNKGFGYGPLRYLTPNELKPNLTFPFKPEISFNYLGEFGLDAQDGLFTTSSLPGGNSTSPKGERAHKLDVIGLLTEGQLTFDFICTVEDSEDRQIMGLAELFKQELLTIVRHCVDKKEAVLTPSDVGQHVELSVEELQDISAMLSGKLKI
ncbi:amino acid adenylation domain-containing protein [Paenibacillus silvestris]